MTHIIPTLEDNYSYVIEAGNNVIIIDCGEATPVIAFLAEKDLTPTHLLCTHHHGDHIAGIAELKKTFPGLNVLVPEKDLYRIPGADAGLTDGENIAIGQLTFECIETPGHTQNHLCFYVPELETLFTGDTLFSMGCGRLFEGTPGDLFLSMQKLKKLPDETKIYCGHEYTQTNARFTQSLDPDNPDLKSRIAEISKLRANNQPTLPVPLASEKKTNLFLQAKTVEKIAQLRQLRDKF